MQVTNAVVLRAFPEYHRIHDEVHVHITHVPIVDKLRDLREVYMLHGTPCCMDGRLCFGVLKKVVRLFLFFYIMVPMYVPTGGIETDRQMEGIEARYCSGQPARRQREREVKKDKDRHKLGSQRNHQFKMGYGRRESQRAREPESQKLCRRIVIYYHRSTRRRESVYEKRGRCHFTLDRRRNLLGPGPPRVVLSWQT